MENFGYTSNGEEITESMVEEFYRVANDEILPNTTLYIMCDGNCEIDENSFSYTNTGTAFGAYLDYVIRCTAPQDTFPNLDFIRRDKDISIVNYDNDRHTFNLEVFIHIRGDEVVTVNGEANCYPYGTYDEEESERFAKLINNDYITDYFTKLAMKAHEQIKTVLSNI